MTHATRQRLFHPWAIAAFAWLVVLAVFFAPVLFGGKVLAPLDILDHLMLPWSDGSGGFGVKNAHVYDAISQYIPYDWAVFRSLRETGAIGWNPCEYGGYALRENTMLCPGDWHHQLYRVLDFWSAWDLGIVLQFMIAGLGMLLLLRGEGIAASAALVGAISYGFYSQHVLWIYHRWVLGASCWLPWVVWSFRRARRRKRLVDVCSAVFVALAIRGGHLQSCVFTVSLLACMFFADCRSDTTSGRPRWKGLFRAALPYVVSGSLACLLCLDVILDTVPPLLSGCKHMPGRTFFRALSALPTLCTSIFPGSLGTPSTLDGFRAWGFDLFEIKFAGAVPLFLALPALFRKNAPLAPRFLFLAGLLVPFTPLVTWVYSRFSVLFGLGCAWLAAWSLSHPESFWTAKTWKHVVRLAIVAGCFWALASVVETVERPALARILHRVVERSVSPEKSLRLPWMMSRGDAFLDAFPIWAPRNIVTCAILAVGLSVIGGAVRRKASGGAAFSTGVRAVFVACTALELYLFFDSWVVFSHRPSNETAPFETPPWMVELQRVTSGKGLMYVEEGPFDAFQLNTPSAYGIRQAWGYETVRPRHPAYPDPKQRADADAWASTGVSHWFSHDPNVNAPGEYWRPVMRNTTFALFENERFDGLFHGILSDGSVIPLTNFASKATERKFRVPAGCKAVTMSESFNPKWVAEIEHQGRSDRIPVCSTAWNTQQINLPKLASGNEFLSVRFHPRRKRLAMISGIVLLVVFVGSAIGCGAIKPRWLLQ